MTIEVYRINRLTGRRRTVRRRTEVTGGPGLRPIQHRYPPCRCPREDCPDRAAA